MGPFSVCMFNSDEPIVAPINCRSMAWFRESRYKHERNPHRRCKTGTWREYILKYSRNAMEMLQYTLQNSFASPLKIKKTPKNAPNYISQLHFKYPNQGSISIARHCFEVRNWLSVILWMIAQVASFIVKVHMHLLKMEGRLNVFKLFSQCHIICGNQEERRVMHETKSYLSHVGMVKLVPNDNFLRKSCSKRSYLGIWPVAFLPPVEKLN